MEKIRYSPSTHGFYPADIDYPNLPSDLIEITAGDYTALMLAQSSGQVIRADGKGYPVAVDPADLLTLAQIKAVKLQKIAGVFAARMAAVKAGYPPDEIQSWFAQKSEAIAFLADNTVSTPLLTAMAVARTISVKDLATRVINNSNAYAAVAGAIIGKRQKYEDDVNAAVDAAAVALITWAD